MKKVLLSLLVFSLNLPVFAITVDEIRQPKPALNKLGVDFEPENKLEIIKKDSGVEKNVAKLIEDKIENTNYTYADLSLKKLANELSQDLSMDMTDVLEDVRTLWVGAATRSETAGLLTISPSRLTVRSLPSRCRMEISLACRCLMYWG